MFGTVLPKLLAGVGTALRDAKKKKKVKGRLPKKKGMLKGSIKKRLTKRNTRKYGGFLGGKNLNKKGKPKKPKRGPTRTITSRDKRKRTKRGPASMRLRDLMRRYGDRPQRPGKRSRKRTGLRKVKPGSGLKTKRHLTYKGTRKKKGMMR